MMCENLPAVTSHSWLWKIRGGGGWGVTQDSPSRAPFAARARLGEAALLCITNGDAHVCGISGFMPCGGR